MRRVIHWCRHDEKVAEVTGVSLVMHIRDVRAFLRWCCIAMVVRTQSMGGKVKRRGQQATAYKNGDQYGSVCLARPGHAVVHGE